MWEAYANYGEWIGDKGKGVAAAKIVVRCVGDEVVGTGVAFKTFILVPLRGGLIIALAALFRKTGPAHAGHPYIFIVET